MFKTVRRNFFQGQRFYVFNVLKVSNVMNVFFNYVQKKCFLTRFAPKKLCATLRKTFFLSRFATEKFGAMFRIFF